MQERDINDTEDGCELRPRTPNEYTNGFVSGCQSLNYNRNSRLVPEINSPMKVVVKLLVILVLTSTQVECVNLRFRPSTSRRHLWGIHKIEGALNIIPFPPPDGNNAPEEIVFKLSSRQMLQDDSQDLLKAVETGNNSLVEMLLTDGQTETEIVNRRGFTPLILAALNGDLVIVRLLVEAKADIDARSHAGFTALHVAGARGHLEVMKYLIKRGAKIGLKTNNGETPLLFATHYGQRAAVHFLLQNGASMDSRTTAGFNALHVAARYGHLSVVEYLLDTAGSQVDAEQNNTETTALFLASENGFPDVVEVLVKAGADLNKTTVQNISPLFIAAQQGHVSVVEYLIDQDADLEAQETRNGATALIIAASRGHEKIVRTLVKAKADLEARTKLGNSAHMCAVQWGFISILRFLLNSGASLETRNRLGQSAIHLASFRGHLDILELLLSQGADLESKDLSGLTPLHLSSSFNQTKSVELLLQKGAQIESRTMDGETALHLASIDGFVGVIELLLSFEADIEARSVNSTMTPLMFAVFHNQSEAVEVLLENGASIMTRTQSKATALHLAVIKPITIVILQNLSSGSKGLDPRDADGDTPLGYASMHGNHQAVEFLIRKGSDPTIENNEGQTAEDLICACLEFSGDFVQCIENSCSTLASRRKLRKLFRQ